MASPTGLLRWWTSGGWGVGWLEDVHWGEGGPVLLAFQLAAAAAAVAASV